jgi:branched-chain amino acid aminotransferase
MSAPISSQPPHTRADANIRTGSDGKWSAGELTADEHIPIHIAATCLHYGQEIFEGLKVYERPDGRVQTFRSVENARRSQRSARKLFMQPVPEELFREAVHRVVRANRRFVRRGAARACVAALARHQRRGGREAEP